jgi:ribulose-phosphate 3-epimerase
VQQIKELGAKASVVLNPATPLSCLDMILSEADMVLLMTVNPGYSGQKFIRGTLPKIKQLREIIDHQGLDVLLEVDGGVHLNTVDDLMAAGVDVFVSGSGVFDGGNIAENVRRLRERLE